MATPQQLAQPTIPSWLAVARSFKGTKEGLGAVENPLILSWAKEIGGWEAAFYTHDSIAWCGLFVGICMKRGGEPVAPDYLGAKNWATWGQPLSQPVLGAVMVFERPGGGHVAFYEGEDATTYLITGGNQSDSVCTERIAKDRCVAMRWPSDITPYGAPVMIDAEGTAISENEA